VISKDDWESFHKVAVIRNPWDRIVSDYHWRKRGQLALSEMSFPEFVHFVTSKLVDPDWISKVEQKEFQDNYMGHFKEQAAYVGKSNDVRILRFEKLSKEWPRFCQDVLKRELPLPVSNDSARGKKHYSEEFGDDQALIDAVKEAYKEDIERFGYVFEKPKAKGFNGLLAGFKSKNKRKLDPPDDQSKSKLKPSSSSSSSSSSTATSSSSSSTSSSSLKGAEEK